MPSTTTQNTSYHARRPDAPDEPGMRILADSRAEADRIAAARGMTVCAETRDDWDWSERERALVEAARYLRFRIKHDDVKMKDIGSLKQLDIALDAYKD